MDFSDVVRTIHEELVQSQAKRERDKLPSLFVTKRLELELNVVVKKAGEAKGGIEIDVIGFGGINLGGSGSLSNEEVQKIKLTFETPDDGVGEASSISGLLPGSALGQHRPDLDLVRAFNALEGLTSANGFEYPPYFPTSNVDRALSVLRSRRDAIMTNAFGQDEYEHYLKVRDKYITDLTNSRRRSAQYSDKFTAHTSPGSTSEEER